VPNNPVATPVDPSADSDDELRLDLKGYHYDVDPQYQAINDPDNHFDNHFDTHDADPEGYHFDMDLQYQAISIASCRDDLQEQIRLNTNVLFMYLQEQITTVQ
jgi:hypothetical protein